MQENTESEKPEDGTSDEEETTSGPTETPENSDAAEPPFEEQEGEVLPPEKKKGGGCGFFLFILLLFGGGSGYLYYTDQVPPQIMEWLKPLLDSQKQQTVQTLQPPPRPRENPVPKIEIEPQAVLEEVPAMEEKIVETFAKVQAPPASEETEHISGSPTFLVPEDTASVARISGNATSTELEIIEPEEIVVVEETLPIPVTSPLVIPPPPTPSEEPEQRKEERSEAVQAYLDFFEATVIKIGELIQTGFYKSKEFILDSLG